MIAPSHYCIQLSNILQSLCISELDNWLTFLCYSFFFPWHVFLIVVFITYVLLRSYYLCTVTVLLL
jgi:hypothetical protein